MGCPTSVINLSETIRPSSVASFFTLLRFVLILKEVDHEKFFVSIFTVFKANSNPLFSISPTFCIALPKPEAAGRFTLNNKSVFRL